MALYYSLLVAQPFYMFQQDHDYGNIFQEGNRPYAPSTSLTKNAFVLI